jgi:hypothetical protein
MVLRLRGNAPNWERAHCLGTAPVRQPGEAEVYDPWFDEDDPGPALDVCNAPACPIRDACLKFALFNNEKFGVWGGMSEADRKVMRRIWRWSSGLDGPRQEWTWHSPEELSVALQEHLMSARSGEEPEEDDD